MTLGAVCVGGRQKRFMPVVLDMAADAPRRPDTDAASHLSHSHVRRRHTVYLDGTSGRDACTHLSRIAVEANLRGARNDRV